MSAQRNFDIATRALFQAQRSATSCIVREHLRITTGALGIDDTRTIYLPDPVSLYAATGGPSGLFFKLRYIFALDAAEAGSNPARPRVTPRMYEYQVLDHNHRELLVYHWQPGRDFAGPDHPHLHVSAALDAQVDARNQRRLPLDKRHLVTGRVSLSAVVRMLITEFDVAPLRHDWHDTLDRTEATVQELEAR